MLKTAGLRTKMLVAVCVVVMLGYAGTIAFITVKTSQMTEIEAKERAKEISYKYGGIIKSNIDNAMDMVKTLAHALEGMKQHGQIPDRSVINNMLAQVLKRNPAILAVDTCWEPNALDGKDSEYANTKGHDKTGRFAPYWYRSSGKISVEPLVNFDGEEWYLLPKQTGKEILTNPYVYPVDGKDTLMATVVAPIMRDTKFLGMVAADISLEHFSSMISGIKPFGTGYGYLAANNGYIVAHPVAKAVGRNLDEFDGGNAAMAALKKGEMFSCINKSTATGKQTYHIMVPFVVGHTDTPWAMIIALPMDKILAGTRSIRNTSIAIGTAGIIVLMLLVAYLLQKIVTTPINTVVKSLKDIAEGEGDLTRRLPVTSRDEIGILSSRFNIFVENLQNMIKEIAAHAFDINHSSGELLNLAQDLSGNASDTNDKSAAVASAAEEMSSNINTTVATMEQSTTNTNMVATAVEEMSSIIQEIAQNAQQAHSISSSAVSKSTASSERMQELKKAAMDIDKVTQAITDISEQTNLLALNATIEAARAGEAGKGFAVVAGEIKTLAAQTADATSNIRKRIDTVQTVTNAAVTDINDISQVISQVNEIVTSIATAVEEQATATKEIAENTSQVTQGINEVNDAMNQNSTVVADISQEIAGVSSTASEMSTKSDQVYSNSKDLSQMAEKLREIVERFKVK